MYKVISNDLWEEVRQQAKKARQRKAAIAFVTKETISFSKGDVLVVNASEQCIRNGETDAPLLKRLDQKGVEVYSCPDLHAKVILLDDLAIVGSANMSVNSESQWIEAAVITDQLTLVSGVKSFIEQLVDERAHRSKKLTASDIDELCKIEVVRRYSIEPTNRSVPVISKLGKRMWVVCCEVDNDEVEDEEESMQEAATELKTNQEELEPLRMTDKTRFTRESCEGDNVIHLWSDGKRTDVYRPRPILLRQPADNCTRFYFSRKELKQNKIAWPKFEMLLKLIGYRRKISPASTQEIPEKYIELIKNNWDVVASAKSIRIK